MLPAASHNTLSIRHLEQKRKPQDSNRPTVTKDAKWLVSKIMSLFGGKNALAFARANRYNRIHDQIILKCTSINFGAVSATNTFPQTGKRTSALSIWFTSSFNSPLFHDY